MSPLNLLWAEPAKPSIHSPETLRFYQPKVWGEYRYKNWLNEKGEKRETKANHRYQQFGVLLSEQQDQARLDLLFLHQDVNQSWLDKGERDQFSLSRQQVSTDMAFNFDSRWFGFSGFSENQNPGWSLQFNPLPSVKLFYKEREYSQAWLLEGGLNKKDSEDFFAQPNFVDYQVYSQFAVSCALQKRGIMLNHTSSGLVFEKANSQDGMCETIQSKGRLALGEQHLLGFNYQRFSHSGITQPLFVDAQVQGVHKLSTEHSALNLDWQIKTDNLTWRVFYQQASVQSAGDINFNASVFGGVWTSMFLGSGLIAPHFDIQSTTFGVGIEKDKRIGWGYSFESGIAKTDVDVVLDYRVNYFPIGTFKKGSAYLDVSSAILLLTDFGVGYRWKRWGVFYRVQQPIPLSVKRRLPKDDQPTVPKDKDSSSWTDYLKQLPPGNRQTLSIEYVF